MVDLDVALATCAVLPEPDADAEPLLSALLGAGLRAAEVAWDGPDRAASLTVLRSTWNYPRRPADFLAWVDGRGGRVVNPPGLVRWNAHKGYLLDLEAAGVPVVPTALCSGPTDLGGLLGTRGWRDIVIKPAFGAGSWRTRRFAASTGAQAFLDELLASGDALVQPYQPAVEGSGERALVWIDGEVTHAVRKRRRFEGEHEGVEPVPVHDDERQLAQDALAACRAWGAPTYGRVDVVRSADGRPRVMELELIEPSLFFGHGPAALPRFVAAVLRLVAAARRPAAEEQRPTPA